MKALGLDIGTTTVSAVVVENRKVLSSLTLKNDSFLPTDHSWEKIQNPNYIREVAFQAVSALLEQHPDVERIGITGQMHGIVYLDDKGNSVSPLYTWQDGRGDQSYTDGKSYAVYLSELTGYSLATGFGMVTHFYNLKNDLIPENASVFSTIHDYIAMLLAGNTVPVTDASDAASLGVFQIEQGCFDKAALEKAGIETAILPIVAEEACVGNYQGKIPVYVAIGDNQASFLGATGGEVNAILVNVGTGSQFSAYTKEYLTCTGLETRPFPGGYLLVGASLCGGRAYALLEKFFRDAIYAMAGEEVDSCYDGMNRLLELGRPEDVPNLVPLFQGTRQEPSLRGSITGLSTENFSPRHLVWATLEGMSSELHGMYLQYLNAGGKPAKLIGSGNGLRKNTHLQNCFTKLFEQPLAMSECTEEAATGAALYAQQQHINP